MAVRLSTVAGISMLALLAHLSGAAFGQDKELPAQITPAAVKKVKQATVYLKVTMEGGKTAEGSGFLAVEPGVVVTNAHVIGMLSANSKPPAKVSVVVHSGESNEIQLTGKLLGVDRTSDLAVLRVEGKLPDPLQFGLKEELFETQKVYIFGFPFGEELGKNITVSESSVSSLRKDARGTLERVQVNGGMHPGNSGGPVVNSLGEVVGVSVAGIATTQINFAIPAVTAKSLLDGRILDVKSEELFRKDSEVRVPLQFNVLDPFERIREVRVEVWTGKPDAKRSFSPNKAETIAGDGPRQSSSLKVAKDAATADVLLPKVPEGQVAWVQPVIVFAKGDPQWGQPLAFDPGLALDRIPANLSCKFADQKERTVHLKSSQSLTLSRGKNKLILADTAELDMLESVGPNPKGALIKTGFGPPMLTRVENERKERVSPDVVNLLQKIPPNFVVDDTNRLRERVNVNLNPRLSPILREQVNDFLTQVCNSYEAANFTLPNRELQPRDTWQVQMPMMLKTGAQPEVVDLAMTCTYLGSRTRAGNTEAVVSFAGRLRGRAAQRDKIEGDITGKFTLDVKGGFVSSAKMTIASGFTQPGSEIQVVFAFDVDLNRVTGNSKGLELPDRTPPADPKIAGKTPDPKAAATALVGRWTGKPEGMTEVWTIKEVDGKWSVSAKYIAEGKEVGSFTGKNVKFEGGVLSFVQEFDKKPRTGWVDSTPHTVRAIGKDLMYRWQGDTTRGGRLLSRDADAAIPDPKPVPKAPEFPFKGVFKKPEESKEPTNYMKIESGAGDYIGQGKNYDYRGQELVIRKEPRGVRISIDGWTLDVFAPKGQELMVGEYPAAKRSAFSGDSPGLDFHGKGRGSNKLEGEFAVWELEIKDNKIVRLAVDFVQRSGSKPVPLTGKVRFNSKFE